MNLKNNLFSFLKAKGVQVASLTLYFTVLFELYICKKKDFVRSKSSISLLQSQKPTQKRPEPAVVFFVQIFEGNKLAIFGHAKESDVFMDDEICKRL